MSGCSLLSKWISPTLKEWANQCMNESEHHLLLHAGKGVITKFKHLNNSKLMGRV